MVLPAHHFFTDGVGRFGCGAIWGRLWVHYPWQVYLQQRGTAMLELLPVILAAMVRECKWTGSLVIVHCDNHAVVTIVNAGYSKGKKIMHLIRCLFFIRAYWNFQLQAEHIRGEHNLAADAISGDNFTLFFQVAPDASPYATPILQALLPWLVERYPDSVPPTWVRLFKNCSTQVWQHQRSVLTDQGRNISSSSAC